MKGYENRQHYHDTWVMSDWPSKNWWILPMFNPIFQLLKFIVWGKTEKLSYLHQAPLNLLDYLGFEHQQNPLNIEHHQQKSSQKSSKILGSSVFPRKISPRPRHSDGLGRLRGAADVPHGADAAALGERLGWTTAGWLLNPQTMAKHRDLTGFSGWWFGTFFFHILGINNHPNWLIFFRGFETTNQYGVSYVS